jgi:signal transduction histidine kinase
LAAGQGTDAVAARGEFDIRLKARDGERARIARDLHGGLQGMRERAECFGARFYVWTKSVAGTEIELLVPARICYRR